MQKMERIKIQFFTPEITRSLDLTGSALTFIFVKLRALCFYTEWSF